MSLFSFFFLVTFTDLYRNVNNIVDLVRHDDYDVMADGGEERVRREGRTEEGGDKEIKQNDKLGRQSSQGVSFKVYLLNKIIISRPFSKFETLHSVSLSTL